MEIEEEAPSVERCYLLAYNNNIGQGIKRGKDMMPQNPDVGLVAGDINLAVEQVQKDSNEFVIDHKTTIVLMRKSLRQGAADQRQVLAGSINRREGHGLWNQIEGFRDSIIVAGARVELA